MNKNQNTLHRFILAHGLPGSGKTTLLTRLYNEDIKNEVEAMFVDADRYRTAVDKAFRDAWFDAFHTKREEDRFFDWESSYNTYVDILCTDSGAVVNTISAIVENFVDHRIFITNNIWKNFEFVIYDFNEDRDNCSRNDELRGKIDPKRSAAITIRRAQYESINADNIAEKVVNRVNEKLQQLQNLRGNIQDCEISVKIEPAKVFSYDDATDFEKMKSKVLTAAYLCGGQIKNEQLYGEGWCTGGSEWSYTGSEWNAESETQKDFEELDNIIEAIDPNIPFFAYKKIVKEVATIHEYTDSDYYHRYEMSCWTCDLNKLTEALLTYVKIC